MPGGQSIHSVLLCDDWEVLAGHSVHGDSPVVEYEPGAQISTNTQIHTQEHKYLQIHKYTRS